MAFSGHGQFVTQQRHAETCDLAYSAAVTLRTNCGRSRFMGFVRRIMQDRSSAGAVAMLALLLFLLQGLTTGVAHGNMAAMSIGADGVICSTHMPDGATGKQNQNPAKQANDCCGTLCRLAFAGAVALLASPIELTGGIATSVDLAFFYPDATSPPPTANRDSQPRGPPLLPHL